MLVRLGFAIVAVVLIVAAAATRPAARPRAAPLTHDAYVWQRRWTGAVRGADLIGGYVSADGHRFVAPGRELAPGATAVVGWATGEDLTLDAR